MAAQKGSDFLVGREDATYAGSFNIIDGQFDGSFQFTDEQSEFTHKTSEGLWTELGDGGTIRALSVEVSGAVIEDPEVDAIVTAIMGSSTRHQSLCVMSPGLGAVAGEWQVVGANFSGVVNEPAKFSLSLKSAESFELAPAVNEKHDMSAALIFDWEKDAYRVSGVNYTSFTSVPSLTHGRASKAWDPGAWNFQSGGAVGTLTEFAASTPRVTSKGLMSEPASTNEVRNARMEGGTDGLLSGAGALPTYFTLTGSGWSGITTITVDQTESGWNVITLVVDGTPSADGQLLLEEATQISALTGEDWTNSMGLALTAGDTSNLDEVSLRILETDSGGSTIKTNAGDDISGDLDSTHRRFFYSVLTSGGGSTAQVRPTIRFGYTSGALSFTLKIYVPQCENLSYASSPVLPVAASPAVSTRDADDDSIATGAWFNSANYSSLVEYRRNVDDGVSQRLSEFNDGSDTDRVGAYVTTGDMAAVFVKAGGAAQSTTTTTATIPTNEKQRIAYSYDDGDIELHTSESTDVGTDANTAPTGIDNLDIGGWYADTQQPNCYLSRLVVWPETKSTAVMAEIARG